MPFEQGRAQLVFKLPNAPSYDGLRYAKVATRGAQTPGLHYRKQISKMSQLHILSEPPFCWSSTS
jgi:hypothetical protein